MSRNIHPLVRSTLNSSVQSCSRSTALPRSPRTRLSSHIFRRGLASDREKDDAQHDFRGQLMQSTAQRIQREKEEQERYSRQRNANKSSSFGSLGFSVSVLGFLGCGYYFGRISAPGTSETASTLPLADTPPPKHDTSTSNLQAAWSDLKSIVGDANISTEESDIDSHSGSSWSSYPNPPSDRPFCIVRPESTEEVSKIARVCHDRKIPITGYSGGTSLEGHFSATRGGICIDFSRMDQIIAVHKDDMDCVVQPAVGWEGLNEVLADEGLFFPPDPGPGAMIGGMVGTGCSGTNAYHYGTMRDWVLSLTVVLADGTVIKTRQRPHKSSAGYDLTRTFIGSEGTLGLVTEATLKLTSKPSNVRVAVAAFNSIRSASECVSKVVQGGVPVAAVELLDDVQMRCINEAGTTGKKWAEKPTLFFKFSGTPTGVDEAIGIVKKMSSSTGGKSFEFAKSEEEATLLWSARKEALWSVMAQKRNESDSVWTTDVAVPISKLPDIVNETKEDLTKSGLTAAIVGHVGDGNFHAIILYGQGKERETADAVVHRMVKRAIELEGTATGEHGVGLVKRDYLEHEVGPSTVDAMRRLKRAFDPLCILNCDKIVRSQTPKAGEVQPW